MGITTDIITALAPDQASLKAASKLMKVVQWPVRSCNSSAKLVWGACQGSGANPYRTVFDLSDHGCKCTCPSRKFPCKHALALMWMYAGGPADFSEDDTVPDWITDWLARRRKTTPRDKDAPKSSDKNISLARAEGTDKEVEVEEDPKALARREAAAQKRAATTEAAILRATQDLEFWISDQLRMGFSGLLNDLPSRCRAIAARMVDGKAGALASRLDELPRRVLALPGEERPDALIAGLGKMILLARAYRTDPTAPETRRAIATSETSQAVLEDPKNLSIESVWEVVGEQITTRRDNLVSQATWLLNLKPQGPRFALLLDFFPASLGRRSTAFAIGDYFEAEMTFYPGKSPLRALIKHRAPCARHDWPDADTDPLAAAAWFEVAVPWRETAPLLLPPGRLAADEKANTWWVASDGDLALPLRAKPDTALTGMVLDKTFALWDGHRLTPLSAQSKWGAVVFNA